MNASKPTMTATQTCPLCGATFHADGVDLPKARLEPLPVHIKGLFEDLGEMLLAETLDQPDVCPASEQLAWITPNPQGSP